MANHYSLISDHPTKEYEELVLRSLETLSEHKVEALTVMASTNNGDDMYINSSDNTVKGVLDLMGALLVDVICRVVENNFDVEPLEDDDEAEEDTDDD